MNINHGFRGGEVYSPVWKQLSLLGHEPMLNLFEALVSSKSKPERGAEGDRAFCCSFSLSSSELYHWLTPQQLQGTGLAGRAVSSWARACHCPEPSMAPTVPRNQPGVLAREQLWRPQTWAPSWLWDLWQVHIYSEPQSPHLENGENILYLTNLPRTEGFLGLWDFQC